MINKKSLFTRSLTAAIFVIVMAVCFFCKEAYCVLFSLLIVGMSMECGKLTLPVKKYLKERICVIASGVALFFLTFLCRQALMNPVIVSLSLLPILAAFIFMMFDCCNEYDFDANVFFPLLYVAVPMTSVNWIVFDGNGEFHGMLLLLIFVIIWMNDVGAYAIGMSFGQRPDSKKLFPALSPKKSWVGLFGGIIFSFVSAALIWLISAQNLGLIHWMVIALIVSIFGICGDLFESLIKRHAAVKDSGNLMPGHGGLLDRFDAALFILPVIAIYLNLSL